MRDITFEPTPNPLATKCVTPVPLVDAPAPFRSIDAAAGDGPGPRLARALLAIPGVAHVLLHPGFVTVVRAPEARWASLKPGVRRALEDAARQRATASADPDTATPASDQHP